MQNPCAEVSPTIDTEPMPGQYMGADRRIHKIYITRNTEYHVRRGICVAVRDRQSGNWVNGHMALKKRMEGTLRFFESGGMAPNTSDPQVGDAIYFCLGGRDLITSRLESVERPSRETVANYRR